MVTDFPVWLDKIISYLKLENYEQVRGQLLSEADFTVKKEDKFSHKRSVQPGDHRRKLQPETIANLNEEYAEILANFGWL